MIVDGHSIHELSDAKRTRHRAETMGFIFQAFNLIPVFTATENVELPLLLARVPEAEARERARETLTRVGLGHRLDRRPPELSGGEQQRVAIARALAGRPRLDLGGRADRKPRLGDGFRGHGPALRAARRRADARARHARSHGRGPSRPADHREGRRGRRRRATCARWTEGPRAVVPMTAASLILVASLSLPFICDSRAPAGVAPARVQERGPASARSGARRARLAARRGDHHRIRRRRRHDGRVDQAGGPHAPRSDRRARHRRGAPPSRRSSSACCGRSSRETSTGSSRSRRSRPQSPHGASRPHGAARRSVSRSTSTKRARFGGDAEATGISAQRPASVEPRSPPTWRARSSVGAGDGSPSTRTGFGRRSLVDRVLPRRGVAGFWLGP